MKDYVKALVISTDEKGQVVKERVYEARFLQVNPNDLTEDYELYRVDDEGNEHHFLDISVGSSDRIILATPHNLCCREIIRMIHVSEVDSIQHARVKEVVDVMHDALAIDQTDATIKEIMAAVFDIFAKKVKKQ